ncbi:plant-specific TFIIB-related protein PTF2 [Senna tora]|uniref:Plant-specific TFIIB-related protein PTF2 n=1 Tax=Senna tora TaxID=362788 RepID=A0A834SUT4_9FABA|nr:plant-specific TFIIB-related protein PTF2 [Senna tora]
MENSRSCNSCGKSSLVRDDVSGALVCSSCGVVQEHYQFEAHIGGINGPQGIFIRVGTTGEGTSYSYKERKFFGAQSLIDELTSRLGLSSKISDIKAMISTITEGEFGQGDWFPVLIGACAYVVMRKDNRPLSMAEVAWVVECDVYELGKMIQRVIDFMDLRKHDFPEFDIVHSLQRSLKISPSFARVEASKVDRMRKQGIFLIQCAVKWFLSTGRRPLPLVVAVLVLVADLNQVKVQIVAQVLPWGKDITTKNVVKNAPFIIQYMERKAMSKPKDKRKNLDRQEFNLVGVISECLRQDDGYGYETNSINLENDSQYNFSQSKVHSIRPSIEDGNKLDISSECLSMLFKNSAEQIDLHECSEWWNGKSELSKKLLLKQVLEKDVGLDRMPPSFLSGCLKSKIRRGKINAAKARIDRIMYPLNANCGTYPSVKKRKRRGKLDGVDWEDLIIETLLLHQVREEEIEKGHYNTLLDLHVFNSGVV